MPLTSATQAASYPASPRLYMALELSAETWHIALSDGTGTVSEKAVAPVEREKLGPWLDKARQKYGVPADTPVVSCYEAGRDGFWVHRFLEQQGVSNVVVDPASLKVDRRARRSKTDRLDARLLLANLIRYHAGETRIWSVVRVPSEEAEDGRRPHRELQRLKKEHTQHRVRILSLLATQGIRPKNLNVWMRDIQTAERWDGKSLPGQLKCEIQREYERLRMVRDQMACITKEWKRALKEEDSAGLRKVQLLLSLPGIGLDSAWLLVMEFFVWRIFRNRRELAGAAGLGGAPYSSGATQRDQGISKAGNPRIRARIIELAWLWIRHQPHSRLTRWFNDRFAKGGSRQRRVGIVAVGRRLLIELWHFVEHGVVPHGAKIRNAA